MLGKPMCGRDGDLPPGFYERQPDGTLIPTKKILTNDPPRPINVAADGTITNVTQADLEYLKDVVAHHKELKTGKAVLSSSRFSVQKIRDFCNRAAEAVMRKK